MSGRLGEHLEALLKDLAKNEPDWQEIEDVWFEASVKAAGTEYEQPLRYTGVAVIARDAEQLRAGLQSILNDWRDDHARVC